MRCRVDDLMVWRRDARQTPQRAVARRRPHADRSVPMRGQLVRAGATLFAEARIRRHVGAGDRRERSVSRRARSTITSPRRRMCSTRSAPKSCPANRGRGAHPRAASRSGACLTLLIVNLVESIARYQDGVTVFFRDMHRLPPDKWQLVQDMRREYAQLYLRVITQGQVDGAFRADMNPKMVTYALLGSCNWFYTWYSSSGTWSAHELGRPLAGVYLNALIRLTNNRRSTRRALRTIRTGDRDLDRRGAVRGAAAGWPC